MEAAPRQIISRQRFDMFSRLPPHKVKQPRQQPRLLAVSPLALGVSSTAGKILSNFWAKVILHSTEIQLSSD